MEVSFKSFLGKSPLTGVAACGMLSLPAQIELGAPLGPFEIKISAK